MFDLIIEMANLQWNLAESRRLGTEYRLSVRCSCYLFILVLRITTCFHRALLFATSISLFLPAVAYFLAGRSLPAILCVQLGSLTRNRPHRQWTETEPACYVMSAQIIGSLNLNEIPGTVRLCAYGHLYASARLFAVNWWDTELPHCLKNNRDRGFFHWQYKGWTTVDGTGSTVLFLLITNEEGLEFQTSRPSLLHIYWNS